MRAPLCSKDPAELLSPAVIEDPHPFLERVREAHPFSRVGESGVHLVTTWKDILEALDREEDFSANLTGVLLRDEEGQPSIFELPPNDGTQVIATADEPRQRGAPAKRQTPPHRGARRRHGTRRPPHCPGRACRLARERRWQLRSGGRNGTREGDRKSARPAGRGRRNVTATGRWWAAKCWRATSTFPRMLNLARENAGMTEYLGQHLENAGSEKPLPADASLLHLLAAAVQDGTLSRSEATGISLVMFGAGGESTSALLGSAVTSARRGRGNGHANFARIPNSFRASWKKPCAWSRPSNSITAWYGAPANWRGSNCNRTTA